MLRLLSRNIQARALPRVAASAMRTAALPMLCRAVAIQTRPLPCIASVHQRSFASRAAADEEEEDAEERPLVPVSESRSQLANALQQSINEYQTSDDEGYKIHVAFNITAMERDESSEGEERKEDELPEYGFNVDIVAPGDKIMRVEALNAPDGEMIIDSLYFPSKVFEFKDSFEEESKSQGMRLQFGDLNEQEQDHLINFWEALGVDDDLAMYVAQKAELVRTQLHVESLKKLKNFMQ